MKHIAKRLLSLLLVVCLVLSVAVIPAGAAETKLTSVYASYAAEGHTNAPVADDVFEAKSDSITVSILTTTDMHGRAYDWDSYKNSALSNNFLQAAKLVAERRAAVDDSILIDVGDILQGSALSSYNILQEGGENSPMATALRYIGYDAFVLGNHEFNYAPQIQWNYYNLLTSTDKAVAGQPVDVICSNVVETETNESVFSPYKTFTYKFEDGTTFTIGLLGFENMNNANWDVASHYEGCTFGHPDNTEKSYVYEWENYYGKEMQEKCDYIIVAMHSGEGNPDIYNQENQGGYFATHTTGVDMLLTGHNHQRNAVTLQNKNGENVLVMNGGGSTLGETVLTLTKGADGKVTVTAAESTMHPLNSALGKDEKGRDIRVPSPDFKSGDPNYDGLKDLITPLFERSDAFVNKKIGTVSGTWDTISNYYLTQSDSYDLVHKAQIWAACTDNNIDPTKEHVISMTTPVAKRGWSVSSLLADGATSGDISLRDCYSLYQYDNNTLYMIRMTGAQLKSWMQHTAQNYRVKDDGQLGGGGFGCDTFYGVNYDVYVGNPDNQRVQNITYADGTAVKDDDTIYACLSSYRLSATKDSDAYGWFASTGITSSSDEVLWDATISERFNNVGGSVPLIIGEYIKEMTAEGKDITPGRETKWTVHAEANPVKTIEVFETTDVHGYLVDTSSGNESTFQYRMAYIANAVNEARANAENDAVLLLDGGDIYQGTPVSNLTYGNALRAAFDAMGYDAVSLGNHEFDWDVKTYAADENGTMPAYEIGEFKGDSNIPVLAYNLYDAGTTNRASFVKDYVIVDKAGVKVALVGYIPDYSMDIMTAKIAPYDIDPSIEKLNAKIESIVAAENPDVVVVVAHASPRGLANSVNSELVDLVVGGHSHSVSYGVADNGVAYIQGNCQAKGYANAKIQFNTETKEVTVVNPSYVNTTGRDNTQNLYDTEGNTKLDPTVLAISHASWDAVKGDMSEVLGVADQSITRRAPIGNSSSTIAGNWLTGLMLEATKELNTVVAFTNSGGIRCDLLANEGETTRTVTVGDIYAITPFGNRLYTYDLTGAELAATVENSFKNSNYGDQFSGMVVKYTAEPDGKDENGRPVRGARTVVSIVLDDGTVVDIKDNTKTYRVAVNEYCATLPGSVFENKTPVQNVNEAPVDNISAIEALRAIGKANNGKLPLDLTERCVKVELVEEDPCEQYTDLDANAWYAESVHFALVNGLFVGFGDGTFRPEAALSRAMVATVLYRQAGSPAVTGTSTFPDLKDDWYADAVAWAQEAKVVIGDDKGLFRPDDDVTREEMVTMLYRFAASQNMDTTTTGDLSNFTDASSVQSYATEPMTWAVGNGIILGMGNNELAPRESATRAQFAAITARLAALK